MDRRRFLSFAGTAIAGVALDRAIPPKIVIRPQSVFLLEPGLREWRVGPNGWLTVEGQEFFPMYRANGDLANSLMHYRWDGPKRQVVAEQINRREYTANQPVPGF